MSYDEDDHYRVRTDEGYMARVERAHERGDYEMEAHLILMEADMRGLLRTPPVCIQRDGITFFMVGLDKGTAVLRIHDVLEMFTIEVDATL